jgi:TolA-binding protein
MARLARSHLHRIPGGAPVALAVCLSLLTAACGSSGTPSLVTAPTTGAAAPIRTALPVAVDPPPPTEAPDESLRNAAPPPAFDPAIVRDPRRPPRALALVVTETQQLESLSRATGATSPDRPLIERRIAENYVELEKAATASTLSGDPAHHRRTAQNAHDAAVRNYESLVAATPGDPRIDEARYFLAYERERGGDLAGARKGYLELIVQNPSSKLVPLAYLAFAEMFFAEGAADTSKWELAKQAYLKVVTTPPPGNAAYPYAWYRLGLVLVNQGDREGGLHAFDKAIEVATAFPQLPGSAELRKEAQAQRDALPTAAAPP